MMEYNIASLAAERYLADEKGFENIDLRGFACDEGSADIVCVDGTDHLLFKVEAKRVRGEAKSVKVNEKRLERVAMRYLVEHPEAQVLSFWIIEVLIGKGATVQVGTAETSFLWER